MIVNAINNTHNTHNTQLQMNTNKIIVEHIYTCNIIIPYGGEFSGVFFFVERQRKPSEIIFVVLNFVTAAQSRGAALRK
jgi:hypothetical protein